MKLNEFLDGSVVQISGDLEAQSLFSLLKRGGSTPVDLKKLLAVSFMSEKIINDSKEHSLNVGEYLTKKFKHKNLVIVTQKSDVQELFKIIDSGFISNGQFNSPSESFWKLSKSIPSLAREVVKHSLGSDFDKASFAWSVLREQFSRIGLLAKSKIDIASSASAENKLRTKAFYSVYSQIQGAPSVKSSYFMGDGGEALKVSFLNLKFKNDLLFKRRGGLIEYEGIGGLTIKAKPSDMALLILYHEVGHILTNHSHLESCRTGLDPKIEREIYADIFASIMCAKKRGVGIVEAMIIPLREVSQSASHRTSTYIEKALEGLSDVDLQSMPDDEIDSLTKKIMSDMDFKKINSEHGQRVLWVNRVCRRATSAINNRAMPAEPEGRVGNLTLEHLTGLLFKNKQYAYNGALPDFEKEELVREVQSIHSAASLPPSVAIQNYTRAHDFGRFIDDMGVDTSDLDIKNYFHDAGERCAEQEMFL